LLADLLMIFPVGNLALLGAVLDGHALDTQRVRDAAGRIHAANCTLDVRHGESDNSSDKWYFLETFSGWYRILVQVAKYVGFSFTEP
jgi:hypothetical protein